MNKTIDTLVKDIKELLSGGLGEAYNDEGIGERFSKVLGRGLQPRDAERAASVWFSNVGSPCKRQLWYRINSPTDGAPLLPSAKLKFMYGDFLEEIILELARLSGHLVEAEQRRLEWNGITGRIDGVIDGHLVDVKSASGFSFKRFESGLRSDEDKFGYLTQLGGYLSVARDIELIAESERNRASFLVINKETGDICLDTHTWTDEELAKLKKEMLTTKNLVENPDSTPDRAFNDEPDGKSGNMKLGTNCSYCDFKSKCWPNLRMFLYSNKPVFLTKVERLPNVPEVQL